MEKDKRKLKIIGIAGINIILLAKSKKKNL